MLNLKTKVAAMLIRRLVNIRMRLTFVIEENITVNKHAIKFKFEWLSVRTLTTKGSSNLNLTAKLKLESMTFSIKNKFTNFCKEFMRETPTPLRECMFWPSAPASMFLHRMPMALLTLGRFGMYPERQQTLRYYYRLLEKEP